MRHTSLQCFHVSAPDVGAECSQYIPQVSADVVQVLHDFIMYHK